MRDKSDVNNFHFDFAISYAGEEEGIASDLFQLLNKNGVKVFFAKNEKVYLLGKSLTSELPYIFGPYTRFVIPIVSKSYIEKYWTKYEFEIATEESKKRGFEFILPIRIDNASLKGLKEDMIYIDLRKEGLFGSVEIMITKLRELYNPEEIITPKYWIITFGLNVEEFFKNYELPAYIPNDYSFLCDWLENDLIKRLSKSQLRCLKLMEDSRNGETLSVRIGFSWNPEIQPLDVGDIDWWEFLEIGEFNEIYPNQYPEEIFGK